MVTTVLLAADLVHGQGRAGEGIVGATHAALGTGGTILLNSHLLLLVLSHLSLAVIAWFSTAPKCRMDSPQSPRFARSSRNCGPRTRRGRGRPRSAGPGAVRPPPGRTDRWFPKQRSRVPAVSADSEPVPHHPRCRDAVRPRESSPPASGIAGTRG